MGQWLDLTKTDQDRKICVNFDQVTYAEPGPPPMGGTRLFFDNKVELFVREPYAGIVEALKRAP